MKTLYNSVKKEANALNNNASVLPAKNKARLSSYFAKINYYTTNTRRYMDGIYAGEKLLSGSKLLDLAFTEGKLDTITINQQKALAKSIDNTEQIVKKMNRKRVRSLATSKYLIPVKYSVENTQLEIDRYTLSLSIEDLIKNGKTEEASSSLKKLEDLEQKSMSLKQKDPAKYKKYPKIEEVLAQMKQSITENLNQAQKPETEQSELN